MVLFKRNLVPDEYKNAHKLSPQVWLSKCWGYRVEKNEMASAWIYNVF
jgi:hypothetical protein